MTENLLAKYPFPTARGHGDAVGASPALASPLPRAGEILLTEGQRQALIKLRGSDIAKAVIAKLTDLGRLKIQGIDYVSLARVGFAINKGSFHVLSPNGRWRADQLAQNYARLVGIHVITYDMGRRGAAAFTRCSCGWVAYRTRSIPSFTVMMYRDAQHHLRHVGAVK